MADDDANFTSGLGLGEIVHAYLNGSDGNFGAIVTDITSRRKTPEFPRYLQISATLAYTFIFLFGVIGNVVVIVVVFLNKTMKNSVNMFLVNLCVADLLVLTVCMPTALVDAYAKDVWYFGKVMCKLVPFLENLVTQASVLTLVAISVERYRVVCRPLKGIHDSITKSAKILPVLWLISTSCNVPYVYLAVYRDSSHPDGTPIKVCRMNVRETWQKAYVMTMFACHFVIPFVVLFVLYTRICYILHFTQDDNDSLCSSHQHGTRRRLRLQVINIILSLVILFFVFHLPIRAIGMWASFTPDYHKVGLETFLNILYTGRIMFYLNHACNPIIYNFVSTKFRHALKSIITRRRYRRSLASSNRRGGNYNTPITRPRQSLVLLVDQDNPNERGEAVKRTPVESLSSSSHRQKLNEFIPMYSQIIQNHKTTPIDANGVENDLLEKG